MTKDEGLDELHALHEELAEAVRKSDEARSLGRSEQKMAEKKVEALRAVLYEEELAFSLAYGPECWREGDKPLRRINIFNGDHPVGTTVSYLKSEIDGFQECKVAKPAYIEGDGTPVVVLEEVGVAPLDKIELLPPERARHTRGRGRRYRYEPRWAAHYTSIAIGFILGMLFTGAITTFGS